MKKHPKIIGLALDPELERLLFIKYSCTNTLSLLFIAVTTWGHSSQHTTLEYASTLWYHISSTTNLKIQTKNTN